ncbi:BRCT domain-containing protein [Sphingomonas sp. PB4P5]|uniref:BRCT domain-containing protein n=1 Tax=Parasphingomonas puruogangriensis TaxID=3096155 RepID=UPI002FC9E89F
MSEQFCNQAGGVRIAARQIDELIGIARGIAADGALNQTEAEFLQKWLAANLDISDQPVVRTLYARINDVLSDGILEADEARDLLDTLNSFSNRDFELGEVLKATTLPVCNPAPSLFFDGRSYCFTGTFNYGGRKECEGSVISRGARAGSLTKKTDVLVIGLYATESWKHSSFGNKILKACEWRDDGIPISIVSEQHWISFL